MRFYVPTILTSIRILQLNCVNLINGFVVNPSVKPIVPFLDVQNDPKISVVILPGTLIRPKFYEPIAHKIQKLCNVDVDVSLAKFSLNAGHRYEVESMSTEILKMVKTDNIVLVGHSASAAVGVDISSRIGAKGLVQWCGTFNSRGNFPWEIYENTSIKFPVQCILAEQDGMFSFTSSLKDFDGLENSTTVFPTYLKDGKHMSGVSTLDRPLTRRMKKEGLSEHNSYVTSIASKIADFIVYVDGAENPGYDKSLKTLVTLKKDFFHKYKGLINSNSRPDVKSMIYDKESLIQHTHIHTPQDMFLTLLYCCLPEIKHSIHFFTMMIPFVFSFGESVSVCPIMNVLPGRYLNNPSIWVKIPENTKETFSRDTNNRTFNDALSEVSKKDRKEYLENGRPMLFENDTVIPLIPGCSLLWLFAPLSLKYGSSNDSAVVVRSPVIRMNYRLNTKLISREQCLEWILVKSFNYYS